MMTNVVARASHIAAGQWGLLTTAQAVHEGISRLQLARLADAGVLQRVGRGVYATTSSAGEHLSLRAAWLALDPAHTAELRLVNPIAAGVVSHASAAGLHQLGDLLDDQHEFTLAQRKQTARGGIRIHRGDLLEQDVTVVEGLPVTTVERTIADLLRAGHDPEHVAQIIGQGARRGVIDLTDLAVHLEPLARRHNQPDGRPLVASARSGRCSGRCFRRSTPPSSSGWTSWTSAGSQDCTKSSRACSQSTRPSRNSRNWARLRCRRPY